MEKNIYIVYTRHKKSDLYTLSDCNCSFPANGVPAEIDFFQRAIVSYGWSKYNSSTLSK